jgi:murein DD-endopeptidase MepM/ murein hydrolase activator NlpD
MTIGRTGRWRLACAALLPLFVVAACGRGGPPAPIVLKGTQDYTARTAPAEPAPEQTGPAVPAPAPGGARVVAVREGDTLYAVSRSHKVSLRDVIEVNGLAPPYLLRVGQRLKLPPPREHVVISGETVYGISRRYGVDMTALVRVNEIRPPYTITVGQRLRLPAATRAVGSPPPERAAASARTGPPEPPAKEPAVTKSPPPPAPTAAPEAPAVARSPTPPAPRAAPEAPAPANSAPPKAVAQAARPAPDRPDARALAVVAPRPRSAGTFHWPLQGRILSAFGPKEDGLHNDGINIAATRGAPVEAAENGVVVYAGNELRGFGNLVLLKHDAGWMTAYAHNDAILVRRGDRVSRGQVIARAGSSGNVSSPQLHFEIRRGTRAVDPQMHLVRRVSGKDRLSRAVVRGVRPGPG